jgi:predicted patatin/cPLA2 family phospholipase
MYSPFIKENKSYCDGGLIANYPIEYCINNGAEPNEILGICRMNKKQNNEIFGETSSLIDYLMLLVNKCSKNLFLSKKKIQIKNQYMIESEPPSVYNMYSFVNSFEERERLINEGVNHVSDLLNST